jgi:hypothetical protein
VEKLRLTARLRNITKKAKELQAAAVKHATADRAVEVTIKNLKGLYTAQRYAIDSACGIDCNFAPVSSEPLELTEGYQQKFILKPYSVTLVVLKVRPKETESVPVPQAALPAATEPSQPLAATEAKP